MIKIGYQHAHISCIIEGAATLDKMNKVIYGLKDLMGIHS
jgi:hypothetical protein